jgi:hypothetical protein
MLLANAHVEFDFELLQKTGGGAGVLRHDLVGKHRVEFDVELAQYSLQLKKRDASCQEVNRNQNTRLSGRRTRTKSRAPNLRQIAELAARRVVICELGREDLRVEQTIPAQDVTKIQQKKHATHRAKISPKR